MNSFQQEHDRPEVDSIATLAEHMVYRLPGCTDLMIRKTLQVVFADFCRLSCCMSSVRDIEMKEGGRVYCVHPVIPKMSIHAVRDVFIGRRKLMAGDYAVVGATVYLHERVHFDEGTILQVHAIEVPAFGSEQAPKWFIEKYGQAIVSGALVKLFGMSGKPWADPAQAQAELVTWENFLTSARLDSVSGGLNNGHINPVDMSDML